MSFKSTILAIGLAAGALAPSVAEAADCFILVHGYKSADDLSNKTKALQYWTTNGDFTTAVTSGTANYAIVGWNSRDFPFWHPNGAGAVASQINAIQTGLGDAAPSASAPHARQCKATDKFYVVAHSQGAQVLTYINGNAKASDPNLNTVVNTTDVNTLIRAMDPRNAEYALRQSAPFATIMGKVTSVITVGGAINGTEGMDYICNGGLDAAVAAAVGKTCVKSLQTFTQYNPSSYTGPSMYRPVYALGGYGTTPISLTTLTGEDDGVVNLASQMNCTGSPFRDLENDFKEWAYGIAVTFTCNSANKRHSNHFNLASVNITHNAEVTNPSGTWTHNMSAAGALNCGNGKNVPNTIAACLSLTK